MSCFWGHQWQMWGEPQTATARTTMDGQPVPGTDRTVTIQQRRCEKCGLVQVQQVQTFGGAA